MKPETRFSAEIDEAARRRVVEVQEAQDARKGILINGPADPKPLRAHNAVAEHPTRTKPSPPNGARVQLTESTVDWWSRPREGAT